MTRRDKLIEYINTADNKSPSVIDFINKNPDCFLDIESCSSFLYSDESENDKLNLLLKLYEVKEIEEQNRSRIKGQKFDSYAEFINISNNTNLSKETFNLLYKCIDKLPLSNNELECNQKSVEAINELKQIDEPDDAIIRFMESYSSNPAKFKLENIKDLSKLDFDKKMDCISAYSKARNKLDISYRSCIDSLCCIDLNYPYDYVLENTAIMQRFSNSLNNDRSIINPIFIVLPSNYFIRKWIATNPATKRRTYFVMSDDSIKNIISSKMMNNDIFFINFNELNDFLKTNNNVPTNTLFFGNHFTDPKKKQDVFHTITSHIAEVSNLLYYDFDREIANKNSLISKELEARLLKDIYISKLWLFPARTIDDNKFKRTILVDFDYGYISNTDNGKIDLFKYEIKKDYNIPYITSNVFHAVINHNNFLSNEFSLRKFFHDEKQENEKKTNNTKNASVPIQLSDEITFMFSFNDNGTRKRTSCYFAFNGKEVDGTRQSPTSFKTREEALEWATNIYPFSSARDGELIQAIINDVLGESLTDKRICLSTVIYTNHEIFYSLPSKLQEEMKFIIHSYIGEFCIDQLSQDYLFSFIESEYSNEKRNISINSILSALAKFYDAAIESGNTSFNTPELLIKEINKNTRNIELAEVKTALTLKNLYVDEIIFLKNNLINSINKHPSYSISTLIRLVTGLEPNIICALLWKDFTFLEWKGTTIYQLIVRREVNNEGTKFLFFEKKYYNRVIPLPSFLADLLLAEKSRQLTNIAYNNLDYLKECTIISGDDHVINGQARILSPIKLYENNRKLFANKKLNGRILEVPDNKGGTIETNIDYYRGDLFKSNLRHYYLTKNYGFSYNQAMYLLGNKASNTFFSNYFDFRNEVSQYNLYKKIETMWKDLINE